MRQTREYRAVVTPHGGGQWVMDWRTTMEAASLDLDLAVEEYEGKGRTIEEAVLMRRTITTTDERFMLRVFAP